MRSVLIATLLSVALSAPTFAAPGEPRLIQGTLEWPTTLAREPVIVVRGDDGRVYFCDVSDSVRHRADALRAGERVSVLGIETARPHELTAVVLGTGDAAGLARALSQGLARNPTAGGAAASGSPTPVSAVNTPPAAAEPPLAPAPLPAPVAAPAPSAAPAAIIMAPVSPHPAPALGAAPPPAPAIVPATVVTRPAVAAAPPPPQRALAPAASAGGGRGQWSRLDGMVESVAGLTLTLKTDDGAVAHVDISQLSPNVAQVLRHGTAVTVYGYPLEQKFEAAGYIQTHPGGPEPRVPARTTR
jgi:hypothetical protein